MFGYEAQLASNSILLAFSRLAFRQQLEMLIENLHVILRPADIASKGGNGEARLDLIGPDDDALQCYQAADKGGVELANRTDGVGLGAAIDDGHLELAVHASRDHLVFCDIVRVVAHQVLPSLLLEGVFEFMAETLRDGLVTSSGLISMLRTGIFFSTIS